MTTTAQVYRKHHIVTLWTPKRDCMLWLRFLSEYAHLLPMGYMKCKAVQYIENSSTASRGQTILFSGVHIKKKIYVIEILYVCE